MANKVYLGLGSNKGNREQNLKEAVKEINKIEGCKVEKSSSVYETAPYGDVIQDNFLNAVCLCKTDLSPALLLRELKGIEAKLGRTYTEKWGPREIDIDILLYEDLVYRDENISIPHKGIIMRDFVVVPLLELDAEIEHPELKIKLHNVTFKESENYIINKTGIILI